MATTVRMWMVMGVIVVVIMMVVAMIVSGAMLMVGMLVMMDALRRTAATRILVEQQ
jgi:hypothetical protein